MKRSSEVHEQSANTKKPRMGSKESKPLKNRSNTDKMSQEKMDVVATSEGKNGKVIHDQRH